MGTQIETVKLLTGNTSINEELVAFYLEAAEQFILAYCGIKQLPPTLQSVKVQIAAKMFMENTTGGVGSVGQGSGVMAGMSDGNQSVSFATNKGLSANFTYDEQSIIDAFGFILNRHRVLHKVDPAPHAGARRPGGKGEVSIYGPPLVRRQKIDFE